MFRITLWLLIGLSTAQAQLLNKRLQVPSKILDRPHELLVYTPPSYDYDQDQRYPVLYLMDGEYNFNYVTGLIELWSNISSKHPEMIVVGISGYGNAYYRHLMRPPWDEKGEASDDGAADRMLKAIKQEIVPAVNKQFRALDFTILSGHSMGGLFTSYAAMMAPDVFDYYIAISPSLWWQQQRFKAVMAEKLKSGTPETNLYMSLANEQGMGVHGFLEMIQAERREPLYLQFKHFPDESHGSVGLPTYEWALGDIFAATQLTDRYFESAKSVEDYAKKVNHAYGKALPVNSAYLRNTCYAHCGSEDDTLDKIDVALAKRFPHDVAFFRVLVATHLIKQEKFEQAENWLKKAAQAAPHYIDVHHARYLLAKANNDEQQAGRSLETVRSLLKTQHIRQWHINEMNLPD